MTEPIAAHIPLVKNPTISINALLSLKKIIDISINSFHHGIQINHDGRKDAHSNGKTTGFVPKRETSKDYNFKSGKEAGKDPFKRFNR